MLERLISLIPEKKARDVAMTAGGMVALLGGRKILGLTMFARGAMALEDEWRRRHPDFQGSLVERWERAVAFYEETHGHPTNRKLHRVGIPVILGGAAGLLLFRPYRPLWFLSASAFTVGWIMNFIGHGVYEKNAPAFADDPLSFLAGPVWDYRLHKAGRREKARDPGLGVGVVATKHDEVNVAGAPAVA